MIIHSLIRLPSLHFQVVEIEVALVPGLPQIHVLGLPDAHLKESMLRLRAALRAQGFRLPRGQQILVQVRPSYIRKSSRGLDLALAAAIAFKVNHLEDKDFNLDLTRSLFYGELALDGHVLTPPDLADLGADNLLGMNGEPIDGDFPNVVVTGQGLDSHPLAELIHLKLLGDLINPDCMKQSALSPARFSELNWKRPESPVEAWATPAADVLEIIAVGEHPTLVCGPRGSGKTTFVESLPSLIAGPSGAMAQDIHRWRRRERSGQMWRPFVRPHHTTSARGLIGGGVPLAPGEITYAHGGILFLDELLEFETYVQDALREPLDHGHVTLRRGREWAHFPARFLFISATNLCPCGNFVPKYQENCACSTRLIRQYIHRLSGPFLDRIQVVQFSHSWLKSKTVRSKDEVVKRIAAARIFRQLREAAQASRPQVDEQMLMERWMGRMEGSRRRQKALSAVARTIADLDLSESLRAKHYQKAFELTIQPLDFIFRSTER